MLQITYTLIWIKICMQKVFNALAFNKDSALKFKLMGDQ